MTERIWDKFLTDQDRAHLSIRERKAKTVFGDKPAILNIDNFRSAAGDERMDILDGIKIWPGSMGHVAWDALDNIADLLATARAAGIPVAHSHDQRDEETGLAMWGRPVSKLDDLSPDELERHLRRYEFMPQAAPIPGEIVVEKATPSAFWGTALMSGLNAWGVDTLIITGESTSGCVRASVQDACSHRYKVVIAEECVYDRHEASHAMNLFAMHQKYATVLPLAEIKEWIAQWAASKATAMPELVAATP